MKRLYFSSLFVLWCLVVYGQSDTIRTTADQMPYFANCTMYEYGSVDKRTCSNQQLVNFIAQNLDYPEDAKEKGIEGTVVVQFVINEHGVLQDAEALNDIGEGCGDAALRLLAEMPRWEAAQHKGQTTSVQLRLPVRFALKSGIENQQAEGYSISWGRLRGQQIPKSVLRANMNKDIIVRDATGNTMPVSKLSVSAEKGSRYISANSNGVVNKDIQRIIKKAKNGVILTLRATIQDNGELIDVKRVYTVN